MGLSGDLGDLGSTRVVASAFILPPPSVRWKGGARDAWCRRPGVVHLTGKPVELAVRAMQYSSRPGEHVLDLFGGSGPTLIAAEQTGRRAFLMELDPLYADIIVTRWEKFTGRRACRQAGKAERQTLDARAST